MDWTADDILALLDAAVVHEALPTRNEPLFATRLSTFRDAESWAIVLEAVALDPDLPGHDGIQTLRWCFGSDLDDQGHDPEDDVHFPTDDADAPTFDRTGALLPVEQLRLGGTLCDLPARCDARETLVRELVLRHPDGFFGDQLLERFPTPLAPHETALPAPPLPTADELPSASAEWRRIVENLVSEGVPAIDPTTGQLTRRWDLLGPDDVERALESAREAQQDWRKLPLSRRADVLLQIADRLRASAAPLADLMAREMGKPVRQGRSEVEKCAWVCSFYAEHAAQFLADEPVETSASKSWVRADPLGSILAIMPWNFPLWQVFRCAAPALMAGNAVLVKHAPLTFGCSEAIVALCHEAGLPDGLLVDLRVAVDSLPAVIEDPRIAAVTFTGSTEAGCIVAGLAGAACKKAVLELGGSDPFVVLASADVDAAVRAAVQSRTLNAGQSCIAAKRIILEQPIADAFLEALVEAVDSLIVGDPASEDTDVGPLARDDLRANLHRQVAHSLDLGAQVHRGGAPSDRPGWFYPITVMTGAAPGMPIWEEEVFGPVFVVRVVEDEAAALAAANDTTYGLGAAVFTRDVERASELASALDAGAVFLNGMVRSDPRIPFGGVKRSGFGRELGRQGIRTFVNEKTVWVD